MARCSFKLTGLILTLVFGVFITAHVSTALSSSIGETILSSFDFETGSTALYDALLVAANEVTRGTLRPCHMSSTPRIAFRMEGESSG